MKKIRLEENNGLLKCELCYKPVTQNIIIDSNLRKKKLFLCDKCREELLRVLMIDKAEEMLEDWED